MRLLPFDIYTRRRWRAPSKKNVGAPGPEGVHAFFRQDPPTEVHIGLGRLSAAALGLVHATVREVDEGLGARDDGGVRGLDSRGRRRLLS